MVSLRQYIEKLIAESEKRTDDRFLAAKEAVGTALVTVEKATSAALVAQDKLTSAAFVAAKEALAEAQVQLTLYKAQSNEWRNTLNDLIAKLMLRPEIVGLFNAVEKAHEELKGRVGDLEGMGQKALGRDESKSDTGAFVRWVITVIVAAAGIVLGYLFGHR